MDVRSFALDHANKGWSVLPLHAFIDGCCTCGDETCRSPAKHPITPNGVKDATTDTEIINRWNDETEGLANIGIATGNGLLVLDVDAKSGGPATLAALEDRLGKLPLTPTVQTGGGGRHFYFRYPEGLSLGNKVSLLPGIDIRGEGGYVVAPPSQHASGQRYRWEAPADTPIADAPTWLLKGIADPKSLAVTKPTAVTSGTILRVKAPSTDLADDPGAPEGQRHARLCQLVGVHLARGEDHDAVEVAALAWGEKCDPPMDDSEIIRTVKSLAAKHRDQRTAGRVVAVPDDVDATPLPEPPPWPELHPDALHGLAGEIVRTLEPHTEADPVGMLGSLLILVGNCIGRQPSFLVEGDHHHVNLFGVLVGESSRGRKGTSMGRVMTLLEGVDDHWLTNCSAAGLSSGEGLIWAVRDPIERTTPTKEKGVITGYQTVKDDPGVEDKRLLVIESEFAQALRVLRREGNTLSAIIRQAWDKGSLRALTKNNAAQATDTHISILGHITKPELTKYLDDTDCFNGFANRFLWLLVRRSRYLPDGGEGIDIQPLRDRLSEAISVARGITALSRSPEARTLWRKVYPELAAEKDGLYGAVTGRAEAQALRLSMLYALLDGSETIGEEHLRAALAVWRYADASARIIFGQADAETEDPLEKPVLKIIRQTPGINRKGLHKALGGHIPATALVTTLAKLRDRRLIRAEMIRNGGRPGECWWPVEVPSLLPREVVPLDRNPSPSQTTERSNPAAELQTTPAESKTPEDRSFGRSGHPLLTLTDLFAEVRNSGGRIVRSDDGFTVQGMEATPAILASLVAHRSDLDMLVPPSGEGQKVGEDEATSAEAEMSKEEFQAALMSL